MALYSIMIVDDQPIRNKHLFDRLFKGDNDFECKVIESWNEFSGSSLRDFDAVLLDVNLDDWGKSLDSALELIGDQCPVVLISQCWAEQKTHNKIAQALSESKKVPFVGTLVLNDLGREGWEGHASSMRSQLRLAIARFWQHGLLMVKDNDPIRILHLSDPQYGDPSGDNMAYLVEKEIPRFVMDELRLNVHFIVITGDITYSGQPDEFEIAKSKLKGLVEAFLPNREDWRERLLLVPGNHDVNLKLSAADNISYSISNSKILITKPVKTKKNTHQKYALQPFRDFGWHLTGNPHLRDSENLCWINDSFRHLGLRFYLLNSAASIDCNEPKKAEIPKYSLDRLVGNHSVRDNLFGIAIVHHGPSYDNNVESINNWQELAKMIQNTPIRMFIHGHGHERLATITSMVIEKNRKPEGLLEKTELLRVMAPTTHLQSNKRPIGERRGFNVITLERSHGCVEEITVDSYDLGEDKPHRSKGAPWVCRP